MTTKTEVPPGDAVIIMSRLYDAPRAVVWDAITDPRHVPHWFGGPGFQSPVCEMDVRPGGLWHHVLVFPNGKELVMDFVYLEVVRPERLVWQHTEHGKRLDGPPTCRTTVTLEDLGEQTRWRMVAQFTSLAARDLAVGMGFSTPIAASNDRFAVYLKTM
jgi:uncharacterized protein YndB with AHSA1/START domain